MIRYFLFSLILVSLGVSLNSCKSESKKDKNASSQKTKRNKSKKTCSAEDYTAIFPKDLDALENYKFEATDHSSTESFTVRNAFPIAVNVEIIQVGCKKLTQELRFEIMDKIPPQIPPKECSLIVMGIFNYFANLHPDLMTFAAFVQVMETKINEFEYNSPILLQDGFTMQIDKMHNLESTLITVVIKKEDE